MSVLSLNCWVVGDSPDEIFEIEIPRTKSVSVLKEIVKEKNANSLSNFDPKQLDLWKVYLPRDNLDTISSLKLENGTKLSPPIAKLSEFFDETVDQGLNIVVKMPPAQSMPRKRRRVEDDGAEEIGDAPGAIPSGTYPWLSSSMIIEQITLIHNAIRGLPNTMDFSDPTMLTMLPFPSALQIPFHRFEWCKQDNVNCFSYMGRLKFTQLYEHMQKPNFLAGFEKIYLYGTSGSGKSHILAALVCQLIREGKRVVYVPDCTMLIDNFTSVIRSALRFAFYDSEPHLKIIESAQKKEDLFTFWAGQKDTYFVVDQLNALELGGRSINRDNVKNDVTGYLGEMRFEHKYVFSASASEQSNREADMKQNGVTVIPINGGMTQEETSHWFNHHSAKLPLLSNEDRQLVDYQTGRIPLLLRALFDNKDFDYNNFMRHKDIVKVHWDVFNFFIEKQGGLREQPHRMDIFFGIMDACLQSRRSQANMPELYDLRYFYIDRDDIGHFTCGVAFETMMLLLKQHRLSQFCGEEWYSAVGRSSVNPVVQGFLAEHICLSQIASHGLLTVSPSLGRMSHTSFEVQPNWSEQLSSTHSAQTVRLYIPTAYNFKAVDAAILRCDSKTVHMYLIQIKLSMRHKLSDQAFYQDMWREWVRPFEEGGYSVKSTFVWIDKKQPANHIEPALVKELRSGLKTMQPEYHSIHIGIEQVDQRLARILGL